MKLVYIAGPFTPTARQRAKYGTYVSHCIDDNIQRATALALRVAESGHMPVCPHSNTGDPRFLSLQTPEFWYAGTLELMRRCDAIALTDDWQESNGACREVIEAERRELWLWSSGHLDRMYAHHAVTARAALRSRGQEP